MNIEELSREIAENILFSHVVDIENLTVGEMTDTRVNWSDDDTLKAEYESEEKFQELVDKVHEQLDKAVVGISWDGGSTWQW